MTFSSLTFLIFFIIVYGLMLIINCKRIKLSEKKRLTCKHSILLIASYIFYGWWDYRFCALMLFLTAIAWLCAKKIQKQQCRKLYSLIGVAVPLLVLGIFKYFNFFTASFCSLFGINSSGIVEILLPVGISFYTFQSMSYTIDVLRGSINSASFTEVALYVSFFPQLVAGPIVKASDFIPQLHYSHPLTLKNLSEGAQIFLIGLFKKIVIADNLSPFVDHVFDKPLAFSSGTVILAVVAYSIQIYCDFSGYSDMAIGCAKTLGYTFLPNFNMPYISRNVTEFWKRWHISLSTWLQEYLYIPLGGNRKGNRYVNLMITMVLGGLWHGANYTFIIWGFLHGAALCIHKLFMKLRNGRKATAVGSILSTFLTYAFVCICWVFFRANGLSTAMDVLHRIFIWQDGISHIHSWAIFAIAVMLTAHAVAWVRSRKQGVPTISGFYPILNLNKLWALVLVFFLLFLTLALAYTNANPFIYFQF